MDFIFPSIGCVESAEQGHWESQKSYGHWILRWIVFRHASQIYKFIGHQGTQVISRLIGIVFTALAVELVKGGILKLMA